VDQPCTTLNFIVTSKIHHRDPNLKVFHILDDQSSCQPVTRQEKLVCFPSNTIGKLRGAWATFVSFLGTNAFQGDGPGLVYYRVLAIWDELSPKEKGRAMGFQIDTPSHTKVTKLKHNTLLGRGMDLNSLTWLLVTCVLFQMYTTLTFIQLACIFSDVTTWHPDQVHLLIFNILHFTFSVGGRRYHVIWLKFFLIHLEVHQLLEKQLQPSMNLHSWIVENPIHQVH